MVAVEDLPTPTVLPPVEPPPVTPAVKVLVVDDEPNNLVALEALLAGLDLELVRARSGAEALRHLLHEEFALILMDVRMPGMDGLETADLIRQRSRCQHTPIIFLTAYESGVMQMFRGYAVGAVDYLCKPIVPEVLRSKVGVFVDLFRKTEEVRRQGELLCRFEQREYERQLAEANERLEAERLRHEIRIAREIQQKLFPAAPLPLAGFEISGASFPAEATGGDYFDYLPLGDDSLAVVIADVSGHGFGPALLMAETRAYLRAFLLTHTDLGGIVGLLNRALSCDSMMDRFATLLLARLDPRTRTLTYVSAGHTTGYVLDVTGAVKAPLLSTGMPLAVLADGDFPAGPPLTLEPGDVVVLITDGMVEAHVGDGPLFGVERLLDVVRANRERTAREIVAALYAEVRRFAQGRGQLDDMTAVVIKVPPGPDAGTLAPSPGAAWESPTVPEPGPCLAGVG